MALSNSGQAYDVEENDLHHAQARYVPVRLAHLEGRNRP